MRTTPSRFSAFVASVDPNLEGRPTAVDPNLEGRPTALPAPPPGSVPAASSTSVLEQRYPAVVRTLTLLWGHAELNEYLRRVASGLDPRLVDMAPAAMAELMLLAEVHRRICPQLPGRRIDDVYGAGQWGGPWQPARYRG